MKNIILILAAFTSLNVMASNISLTPGSEITISASETTTVRCAGERSDQNNCTVKRHQYNYSVEVDGEAFFYGTKTEVISEFQHLKKVGICN
jgi:hypothetical protein